MQTPRETISVGTSHERGAGHNYRQILINILARQRIGLHAVNGISMALSKNKIQLLESSWQICLPSFKVGGIDTIIVNM